MLTIYKVTAEGNDNDYHAFVYCPVTSAPATEREQEAKESASFAFKSAGVPFEYGDHKLNPFFDVVPIGIVDQVVLQGEKPNELDFSYPIPYPKGFVFTTPNRDFWEEWARGENN